MPNNIYYVYCYKHPITLQPFYIGKGKNDRAYIHLKPNNPGPNNFFFNKLQKIRKTFNLEPIVEIVKNNLTEHDAFSLEIRMISLFGRDQIDENGILTNRTKGGDGVTCPPYKRSDDHKIKMSLALTGKTKSDSAKKANSDAQKEVYNRKENHQFKINRCNWLGKHHSEETKKKISDRNKGRVFSDESIKKMSKSKIGEKSPTALEWTIINPNGIVFITRDLVTFCKEWNLNYGTMTHCALQGPLKRGPCKGWEVKEKKCFK